MNCSSDRAGAERMAEAITDTGGQAVVGGSVVKIADVAALFAGVKQQFGKLDVRVNNAGVFSDTPLKSLTEPKHDRHFNTSVKSLLFCSKAALPLFGESSRSNINISSVVSRVTFPGISVYVGTKSAVDTITGTLSKELGAKKIRVNAINPYLIMTEGTDFGGLAGESAETERRPLAGTPLGRSSPPPKRSKSPSISTACSRQKRKLPSPQIVEPGVSVTGRHAVLATHDLPPHLGGRMMQAITRVHSSGANTFICIRPLFALKPQTARRVSRRRRGPGTLGHARARSRALGGRLRRSRCRSERRHRSGFWPLRPRPS